MIVIGRSRGCGCVGCLPLLLLSLGLTLLVWVLSGGNIFFFGV